MEFPVKQSVLDGRFTINSGMSFMENFKTVVERVSIRTAILYEGIDDSLKSVSFGFMDELSSCIASYLLFNCKVGESKNDVVAVSLEPSEYLPIILLAILKAGMSYLPIDVEFPENRIKYILDDSQPLMCIIEDTADTSIYNETVIITIRQLLLESGRISESLTTKEDPYKSAIILYTSGSTGTPKGVELQYSALMNRLEWQWKELPYREDEHYCIFKTALTFVDSVCEIWGPLLQGRTLVVVPRNTTKDPEKFTAILTKYKIQRIVLVPTLLRALLTYSHIQDDKSYLETLNLWICSGETLSASLVQEFFCRFSGKNKVIANFYGSTEVMGDVTFHIMRENDSYSRENRIPIGKPVDNCIVYITDQHLNLLPEGEIGELLIAGRNLANGYIHDDSSRKFIDNPFCPRKGFSRAFRTGDYAKIDDNLLFYEGRQDNQVKIRGQRVDLSEVEKAVLKLPMTDNAFILCDRRSDSEQVILCFLVLKQEISNVDKQDIKALLNRFLLPYMIPEIIITKDIPLLPNGKTDRQKLLELYEMSDTSMSKHNEDQSTYNYDDISTENFPKAKILFSTIASVIGLNDKSCINIHSNFYELGGNSLNSVYTVLKLRERGFLIGITDFITAKSIEDIMLKMKPLATENQVNVLEDSDESNLYLLEMLNDTHKEKVIEMITKSFLMKADLERWLMPEINEEDYFELMQKLWDPLVERNFSFVIKSSLDNTILSVALNFDANDEPDIKIDSKLNIIFEFLEYLEKPIRETRLPRGKNKIFHTFMMATGNHLDSAENVILMRLMEQRCLEIATERDFSGIFTTNTSPLTQQLGTDVFKYEIMLDYQVNQYITIDGLVPFAKAPDTQRAVVSWKEVGY